MQPAYNSYQPTYMQPPPSGTGNFQAGSHSRNTTSSGANLGIQQGVQSIEVHSSGSGNNNQFQYQQIPATVSIGPANIWNLALGNGTVFNSFHQISTPFVDPLSGHGVPQAASSDYQAIPYLAAGEATSMPGPHQLGRSGQQDIWDQYALRVGQRVAGYYTRPPTPERQGQGDTDNNPQGGSGSHQSGPAFDGPSDEPDQEIKCDE